MFCGSCGAKSDDDARFCDRCGSDLRIMAKPEGVPSAGAPAPRPAPPVSGPSPVVFPPVQPRAWWYPIGVWTILSAFFLFIDLVPDLVVQWAYWPVGITGIFLVGFPVLNLLERRASRRP